MLKAGVGHIGSPPFEKSAMPDLSVILCTHNPRMEYLERVLRSLGCQTLPYDRWELVIVDNASSAPLKDTLQLQWHPASSVVVEASAGLIHARLHGIRNSLGELIVFVDDDNVLEPDYLSEALRIGESHSFLGAWGAGTVRGEFETPLPVALQPYVSCLVIRQVTRDTWSNACDSAEQAPAGAGLCVRRDVAEKYARNVVTDIRRQRLGRNGDLLGACEDVDLAFTACDLGMGTGTFPSLQLTHLIPSRRLTCDYFIRLEEGFRYSEVIMKSLRQGRSVPPVRSLHGRILDAVRLARMTPMAREMMRARKRGVALAHEYLATVGS